MKVFDVVYPDCSVHATIAVDVQGAAVTATRYSSSDGNDCIYRGTLGNDGRSVAGTYSCTKVQPPPPNAWSATISVSQ